MAAVASGSGLAIAGPERSPAAGGANRRTAYQTAVNPGSAVQLATPKLGFALAGQPANSLDNLLAAPAGLTIAWPSPALLVSRDGGRSWRRSLSTATGFWGIAVANDALHGLAVGVTTLYRTVDGGRHWQRASEPRQPLVRAAYIGDAETAVGVTTTGRVVVSRDDGVSWHRSSWTGQARAMCVLGALVVIADPEGRIWVSKSPDYPFTRVARGPKPPIQYGPWWVDLSCNTTNAVESMFSACEAACGGGTETVVREAFSEGVQWRTVAKLMTGAANPTAAQPAAAVALGTRSACILAYPRRPTLEIRCTSDGGRSFRQARTPTMPASEYPSAHLQGVSFFGPALGWLLVVDSIVRRHRPPRYQTEVWSTADGAATWRVASAGPIRRVPPLP